MSGPRCRAKDLSLHSCLCWSSLPFLFCLCLSILVCLYFIAFCWSVLVFPLSLYFGLSILISPSSPAVIVPVTYRFKLSLLQEFAKILNQFSLWKGNKVKMKQQIKLFKFLLSKSFLSEYFHILADEKI